MGISEEPKLLAYTRKLLEVLGSGGMDLLSGTGVALGMGLRQDQTLSREMKQGGVRPEPGAQPSEPSGRRTETGHDLERLSAWCRPKNAKSLLLQAPFGIGKSVLLARFAVELAAQAPAIRREDGKQWIPLPVRLRDLHSDAQTAWQDTLAAATRSLLGGSFFSPADIEKLNGEGLLLCLYDGHDELGSTEGSDIYNAIRRFHGNKPFLISSRYNDLDFSEECIYELHELSESSVFALLDTVLGKDSPKRQQVQEVYQRLQPTIGELLRRPLFLATWASRAKAQSIQDLPTTIDGLMTVLTQQCFGRAMRTLTDRSVCPDKPDLQKGKFPALGYYLLADADAMFDGAAREDSHRTGCIAKRYGTPIAPPDGYDAAATGDLALHLGLLMPGKDGGSWVAKIPVTEYLVGRYLADLAMGSPAHKQAFIHIMRRWCYRPRTHDTLDYMAYHLQGQESQQEAMQVLDGMIEWMCRASDDEPYRADKRGSKPPQKAVADCLIRPAAWYALRLADLTGLGNATRVATSVAASLHPSIKDAESIHIPRGRSATNALFAQFIAAYAQAREKDKDKWAKAIHAAAGRVAEDQAEQVVRLLINTDENVACGGGILSGSGAIDAAAGRVAEDQAEQVVRILIESYRDVTCDEHRRVWAEAIGAAAGRVAEDQAERVVRVLINAGGEVACAGDLKSAIEAAAGRVAEDQAEQVVRLLIDGYRDVARNDDKWAWAGAIMAAAGRVAEDQAEQVVRLLIDAGGDVACRRGILGGPSAIEAAAGRVAEDQAEQVVRILIESYRDLTCDEHREAWAGAIKAAAGRVAENQAEQVVRILIDGYLDVARQEDKRAWASAIEAAAERVAEDQAEQVVRLLINPDRDAAPWKEDRQTWVVALWCAAGRVTKGQAEEVVRILIEGYRDAARWGDRRTWVMAIRAAAGRVADDQTERFVRMLIDGYRDVARNEDQGAWARAILAAAGRVAHDQAEQVVRLLIESYRDVARNEEKEAWAGAIKAAAGRVAEDQAEQVVRVLIDGYRDVARNEDKGAWAGAIKAAAGRVAEDQAEQVVRVLINAGGDVACAGGIRSSAIEAAAGRVAEDQAEQVVRLLIDGYRDVARKDDRRVWAVAIEVAAGRVAEDQAEQVIRLLIDSDREAAPNRDLWVGAVMAAAGRVAEDQAEQVVRLLIDGYRDAACWAWVGHTAAIQAAAGRVAEGQAQQVVGILIDAHKNEAREQYKWVWAQAIKAAAGRVANVKARLAVYDLLLTAGLDLDDVAFAAVASSGEPLAILAGGEELDADRRPTGNRIFDGKTLTPMLRTDERLFLDPNGVVMPDEIRQVLEPKPPRRASPTPTRPGVPERLPDAQTILTDGRHGITAEMVGNLYEWYGHQVRGGYLPEGQPLDTYLAYLWELVQKLGYVGEARAECQAYFLAEALNKLIGGPGSFDNGKTGWNNCLAYLHAKEREELRKYFAAAGFPIDQWLCWTDALAKAYQRAAKKIALYEACLPKAVAVRDLNTHRRK